MNDIHDLPGYLIRRLHQIAVSSFASELAAAGFDLTPIQVGSLTMLRDNPGIDQATLSGLLGSDRASTGAAVGRLESRGYIERTISATDRRARCLYLTERGRTLLQVVWPAVRRSQEGVLVGLDEAERATFVALLTKVAEAGNEISRAPLRPVTPAPDTPDARDGTAA